MENGLTQKQVKPMMMNKIFLVGLFVKIILKHIAFLRKLKKELKKRYEQDLTNYRCAFISFRVECVLSLLS
jgi:hypothetical protein